MLVLLIVCFIAGSIGGVLQGMLGVGTGVIMIPLLTYLLPHYGIDANIAIHVALATSMAIIVISSLASVIAHHQHQNIRWDIFKRIFIFSMFGSALGALVASYLPARLLEILFAFFLFYTALHMIKNNKKETSSSDAAISTLRLGIGGSLIGITGSLVGIGGGLFMVPFLNSHYITMRQAVGTSTVVGLPVAIIGTTTYIFTGLSHIGWMPGLLGYVHWPIFIAASLGGFLCARIGAKLVKIMNPSLLKKMFAICIVLVGIKMLL